MDITIHSAFLPHDLIANATYTFHDARFTNFVEDFGGVPTQLGLTPTLSALKPAFSKEGTITAGNASQISDAGAALVVMPAEKAKSLGLEPLATIVAHGQVAGPDTALHLQPANATRKAAQKAGLDPSKLDLYEFNEAFAAVSLAAAKDLGLSEDKVNVNGGAVALGHPIGMSGARLILTLAYELKRRGGGVGAAALCGGGGQGDALIIRV